MWHTAHQETIRKESKRTELRAAALQYASDYMEPTRTLRERSEDVRSPALQISDKGNAGFLNATERCRGQVWLPTGVFMTPSALLFPWIHQECRRICSPVQDSQDILHLKDNEWKQLPKWDPPGDNSLLGRQDKAQDQKRRVSRRTCSKDVQVKRPAKQPGDSHVHSQDESRIKAMATSQANVQNK